VVKARVPYVVTNEEPRTTCDREIVPARRPIVQSKLLPNRPLHSLDEVAAA
jgi:hypothetical protein